jgi:hypothetical protein
MLIILLSGLGLLAWTIKPVAATSTLRGTAWWGNQYKFVYFNCLDDVMGDQLDASGNLNALPAPRGFHFYSQPCTSLVHQVLIADNGNFSGSAWNYSDGLISFSSTTPAKDYVFNSHCPSTCNAANNCWACYNPNDQRVYGWAQVNLDGTWIKLDSTATIPTMIQSWNLASSTLPGHSVNPGDFVGYASSNLGDLSFNCENENISQSACNSYKVWIDNLQVGYMTAPNWSYSQACQSGALNADLRWSIKSGQQYKYEVVVNTGATFNTSTHNYVCWSGIQNSTVANHFQVPVQVPGNFPGSDCPLSSLTYNQDYYWWVRLFDGNGNPSPWYQFGSVPGSSGVSTFHTYKHEFPSPFFSWSPFNSGTIIVSTSTDFTSNSRYYPSGSTSQSCSGSNCQYLWTTTDDGAQISATTSASTSIVFLQATGTTLTLSVTDADNYVCSTSTSFTINYGLPLWHEIKTN